MSTNTMSSKANTTTPPARPASSEKAVETTGADPQRCLIIEDQADAAQWMARAVRSAFPETNITFAHSISEAQQAITESPDLALLDLGLPDGSGLNLIPILAEHSCDVVVATIFADDEHLFRALQLGARGYLLKDHTQEELVTLLRGIRGGQPPLSAPVAQRLLNHFQASNSSLPADSASAATAASSPEQDSQHLSPREVDILTLLAKGYTIRNAAEMLDITYNTAAGYAKTVYNKLNVTSRAEATLEAQRRGYVANSAPDTP